MFLIADLSEASLSLLSLLLLFDEDEEDEEEEELLSLLFELDAELESELELLSELLELELLADCLLAAVIPLTSSVSESESWSEGDRDFLPNLDLASLADRVLSFILLLIGDLDLDLNLRDDRTIGDLDRERSNLRRGGERAWFPNLR